MPERHAAGQTLMPVLVENFATQMQCINLERNVIAGFKQGVVLSAPKWKCLRTIVSGSHCGQMYRDTGEKQEDGLVGASVGRLRQSGLNGFRMRSRRP